MSEKRFQMQVRDFLKKRDALVLVTIGNTYQRGFPDMYVAHKYWTGWLELKFGSGRLRDVQVVILRELRRRGVPAYVFRKTDLGTYYLANEQGDWSIEFESIEDTWEWLTEGYNGV